MRGIPWVFGLDRMLFTRPERLASSQHEEERITAYTHNLASLVTEWRAPIYFSRSWRVLGINRFP